MPDGVTADDLQVWVSGLDALFGRVAGRFGRVEPRKQARAYVMGLLAPVERKNGWQLAEAAGDSSPDRMQRLLNSAGGGGGGVRVELGVYVVERVGRGEGVLIVDETGFNKRGVKAAGVQRKYNGKRTRLNFSHMS